MLTACLRLRQEAEFQIQQNLSSVFNISVLKLIAIFDRVRHVLADYLFFAYFFKFPLDCLAFMLNSCFLR